MQISINGTMHDVKATNLAELLSECGYTTDRLATAVNETFVPRAQRSTTELTANDRVEILAPMQGG